MYAYCANNPIVYVDPNGLRCVGFGFQLDLQTGDISNGVEVVIYTDPQVCNGENYLIVIYTYSGYDLSVGDLAKVYDIAEALVTTAVFETHNADVEAWYSAVTFVLNGAGISGGAFVIDGNDDFVSPESYSGGFETWSFSVPVKNATVTGFHAFSSTCDAYGVKIGVGFDGLKPKKKPPFGFSYSRSFYSDPHILEF